MRINARPREGSFRRLPRIQPVPTDDIEPHDECRSERKWDDIGRKGSDKHQGVGKKRQNEYVIGGSEEWRNGDLKA